MGHFEDLSVNGRIMLKFKVDRKKNKTWTVFRFTTGFQMGALVNTVINFRVPQKEIFD
jgi:hypothetical protein